VPVNKTPPLPRTRAKFSRAGSGTREFSAFSRWQWINLCLKFSVAPPAQRCAAKCYPDWLCILRARKEEKNVSALAGLLSPALSRCVRAEFLKRALIVDDVGRYRYRKNISGPLQARRAN